VDGAIVGVHLWKLFQATSWQCGKKSGDCEVTKTTQNEKRNLFILAASTFSSSLFFGPLVTTT
jgi:hypothetical protein